MSSNKTIVAFIKFTNHIKKLKVSTFIHLLSNVNLFYAREYIIILQNCEIFFSLLKFYYNQLHPAVLLQNFFLYADLELDKKFGLK